jgi:hypothetical protein
MLNLGQIGAETTDNLIGSETSGFASVIDPATSELIHGIFGIVVVSGADNALIKIQLSGIVDALVGGVDAAALYEPLTALNGDRVLTSEAPAPNSKQVGIVTTVTAAGTDELVEIIFDGIYGFGRVDT